MLVCCRELYVCQGFPVSSTMDREHFIETFMLFVERVDGTLWIWSMNSRDVIPSVTSDWWTIYVYEFSVTRWTPSSRHLCCLRSDMPLFQLVLMEHSSSSVHHRSHLQPCQLTLIISSFVRRRLLHQDYNSVSWSTTFRVNFEKLYNIANYNSQPLTIPLLRQRITICDYPPIPKNVIKHYNILSIAENWYIFFSSQIPTPRAYSTTPILYRNCS